MEFNLYPLLTAIIGLLIGLCIRVKIAFNKYQKGTNELLIYTKADVDLEREQSYKAGLADGKEMYENELLEKQAQELKKGFN